MRSAVTAVAWEFWSANRRGWLLIVAAVATCAVVCRLLPGPIVDSDELTFIVFQPFVASLILAAAFCNFTNSAGVDAIAGFPRHLFSRPVTTGLLVACVMSCAVLSVIGLYVVWAELVFAPLGVELLVRWPMTIIAAGVVLYQAILWCLSAFRITRVVVLSVVVTALIGIGFMPYVMSTSAPDEALEAALSAGLLVIAGVTYAATVAAVGRQRRGGGFRWQAGARTIEMLADVVPRRTPRLRSADEALGWIEWRRSGWLLPATVLISTVLILEPAMWLSGRGPDATFRAAMWLFLLPMLLSVPIGKGFAKPDMWSLEVGLAPFFTQRPVSGTQMLSAKLRVAAVSTIAAWAVLILTAPPWLYATADLTRLRDFLGVFAIMYSSGSLWAIAVLALVAAMLLTWSLLVGTIWLGHSGRPVLFYAVAGVELAVFVTLVFAALVWLIDDPVARGGRFVNLLPWLLWTLATLAAAKSWIATWCVRQSLQRGLISRRAAFAQFGVWLAATGCLVLLSCLVAPRVVWLRDALVLASLLAVPIAGLYAAAHHRMESPSLTVTVISMNNVLYTILVLLPCGPFLLAWQAVHDLPERVVADGHQLRLRQQGVGSPAVVMEIGLGGFLEEWSAVQTEVAGFTQAISYDRVGRDYDTTMLTGEDVARELHAALVAAGVGPPYVLVGQSFGGVYNRIFASLYPDEIAGIVLLDPAQEDFIAWLEKHHPDRAISKNDVHGWPEGAGIWDTLEQLQSAPPLPGVPVVVVTGTKVRDQKLGAQIMPVWIASHERWVQQLPLGKHIRADCGHGVHVEASELVVDVIREVVESARASRSGRPAPKIISRNAASRVD